MTAFTVMSFNIKGAFYEDGANNWPFRAALNVATIKAHDPDLIGFQELQSGNQETYATELPGYEVELGAETARENQSGHHYYCAIYWKAARFEAFERGHFFLNETPDRYALDWGVTQGRTVNWVKLLDKVTGRRLLHLNSHLPHDSELGRANSAYLIVRRLPDLLTDVDAAFMTADFNARAHLLEDVWLARLPVREREFIQERPHWMENTQVYDTFQAAGFRDLWLEAGNQDGPAHNTFHGMTGDQFPHIGMRIDWILCKDIHYAYRVHSSRIVRDAQPPLFPSDHYPVVAVVE